MGEAADRWRQLVEGRLAEMEQLEAGRGNLDGRFWDKRAKRFRKGPMATAATDPMLSRLRKAVGPGRRRTLLDVGSGPGRFSLALAPRAAQVTAVDPSRRMLQLLRERAAAYDLTNVRTVHGKWQDVPLEGVVPADVVLCSHVLTLVADAAPFVRKLHEAARHRVLLYVGAYAVDAVLDPFWRHFHEVPRRPGPSYVDAVKVVEELGLRPDVEVVEVRARSRHESLADAVEVYRDQLVLPRTAAVRKDLAKLLDPWLQRRDGGLYAPFRTQPAAIISWPAGEALAAP